MREDYVSVMEDYTITWQYLIEKMKEKYGISPDSTERFSLGEIEYKLECILYEMTIRQA